MLERLFIRNYALIDEMDMAFSPHLNVITGETGTGKSIMLKGLGLILGKRAEKDAIRHPDKKIVVEGEFDIRPYHLQETFEKLDLDWEPHTIIRREITPAGKSRAFVNDTPVRLETLEQLGQKLVDIHSQHQHLLLQDKNFRYDFLDAMAGSREIRTQYGELLKTYREIEKTLARLQEQKEKWEQSYDYRQYQLSEMEKIDWERDWEEAENQLKKFEHQEEILAKWQELKHLFENETGGILDLFRQAKNILSSIARYDEGWEELARRTESLLPELSELFYDIENQGEQYVFLDINEKQRLETELNRLYDLMRKHRVNTPEELHRLYLQWQSERTDFSKLEEEIAGMEEKLKQTASQLDALAEKLHTAREKILPEIEEQINTLLHALGMPHSIFKIVLERTDEWNEWGKNKVTFLLSPDKGKTFGEVKKIASGGELSRLMLAIKYLLSQKKRLPTIVFDEIDAGISGEVARKTAAMLHEMSRNMQLIVVTHLPQTAVKGDKHFKVFKTEKDGQIGSTVKTLSPEERIYEIAEMIEGKPPSNSAVQHARHLLEMEK